ncbi:protein EMBRYONIC FLOWER 1 [Senna tora]|uniref:Protein EMBRYONIC FLOWER 1 n=1 Tax=Senna tora TaxID=362788 RepID=A0A834U1D0_9FABA|nr:protein EMBRYONIC FLOWER 1 [Senna tora]
MFGDQCTVSVWDFIGFVLLQKKLRPCLAANYLRIVACSYRRGSIVVVIYFIGDSNTIIEFMRSYIQIDSISIDLSFPIDKSSDPGKCENFSMRGYVSEIRKKDWKLCWPFPLQHDHHSESEQSRLLPPSDVPKLRCCQNGRTEIDSDRRKKDDRTNLNCSAGCISKSNCSNAALTSDTQQQVPIPVTFEGKEIDLNNSTNLSTGNDHVAVTNEKEKKSDVVHEISADQDINHQMTTVALPEAYGGVRQEEHTNDRGHEGKEDFDVELDTSNPKCVRSSAEICNGGTIIAADDQCQKEIEKACTVLGERTIVTEAENIIDHTAEPPPESVACHDIKPGSTDNLVKNEFQDHHPGKSTGLPRKRPRKVRLLADLLSENGETKTEQITIQESPSKGTSIPPGKADVQGDLTKTGQSRKRKFIVDEEQIPAEMCSGMAETELQNLKEHTETIDTPLNNGSKDVSGEKGTPDAVKRDWYKPEIERSHTMDKKKIKRVQFVGDHLISEPLKMQQKQNPDNMDFSNEVYASKTTSRVAPALADREMNNFPLHAPRTESESKLSKGKGKMLQVDEELSSLSYGRNGMPVECSYAHKRAKPMPNMSVTVPIHSAEGAWSEKDPEERLLISQNSSAHKRAKVMPNTTVAVPVHSAEGALNDKALEEGLHLSLNSYLATQAYNKKRIRQLENQLPFSLPFQEGTSKAHQFIRKDRETYNVREPINPLNIIPDDISGKRVFCEVVASVQKMFLYFPRAKIFFSLHEITGARDTRKTAQVLEQVSNLQRYGEQTADNASEQGTEDDVPRDILELMAKFQYERGLPDEENESGRKKSTIRRNAHVRVGNSVNDKKEWRLLQEDMKRKPEGRHGKNGMVMRGENARSRKINSVSSFSPFDGYRLNMNSLSQTPSLYEIEVSQHQMKPSNGFCFSPESSSQFGSAQNRRLSGRSTADRRSYDATNFQAQGECGLHETILQQDKASRIWGSLTPNHVSLGYDIFRNKVASSCTSSKDVQKPNIKRDIDLNYISLNASDHEKFSRRSASGSFSRMNSEYPYSCRHDGGIEPLQNLRGSQHLYSNETIPAMHLLNLMDASKQSGTPFNASVSAPMLKRPPFSCDSNKFDIGPSKAPLGSLKRPSSDYYSRSYNISEKSHARFQGYPTFGASSSIQPDEKFSGATSFNGRIPSKSEMKDKMKISNSEDMHNRSNTKQILRPCLEKETSLQHQLEVHDACGTLMAVKNSSESNTCSINRNPADFTMPETGNVYMIKGEDLKFESSSISRDSPYMLALHSGRQRKNLKPSKLKEHARH